MDPALPHEGVLPEPARARKPWRLNLPLTLGSIALAAAPLLLSVHYVDLLVFAALLAIGGLGVGFLLGQAGIINLAQVAFYGIGAYATAHVTVAWHLPGVLGLLLGVAISATFALAIGLPLLRLSGHFLALATLALLVIVTQLFFEWDWLTGGSLGIGGIPKISAARLDARQPSQVLLLHLADHAAVFLAAGQHRQRPARTWPCARCATAPRPRK